MLTFVCVFVELCAQTEPLEKKVKMCNDSHCLLSEMGYVGHLNLGSLDMVPEIMRLRAIVVSYHGYEVSITLRPTRHI